MFIWYFWITIKNWETKEERDIHCEVIASTVNFDYFHAWKEAVDKAKKLFFDDLPEIELCDWYIASIEDTMRRG